MLKHPNERNVHNPGVVIHSLMSQRILATLSNKHPKNKLSSFYRDEVVIPAMPPGE